jgi:hypothetical protein
MKTVNVIFYFLIMSVSVFSCTSFVYDTGAFCVRGMNFDYENNPEVRMKIEHFDAQTALLFSFKTPIGFAHMIGINERGIFATTQSLSKRYFKKDNRKTVFIHDVFLEMLKSASAVSDLEVYLTDKRVRFSPMMYTHIMIADKNGGAVAIEVGERDNQIIKKDGDLFAMANFPLYQFIEKPYDQVFGRGAESYKGVWKAMLESEDGFGLEEAIYTLEQVVIPTTECSVIYFPLKEEIYVGFDGNFDKMWKISLKSEMIETFKGFDEKKTCQLNANGILKSELLKW